MPREDSFGRVSADRAQSGTAARDAEPPSDEWWWRWGRIELPVQNRVAGNLLQVFPAYFELRLRTPDRRGVPLAIRLTSRPFGIAHRSRRYRIPPGDAFTVRQEETVSALVAT